MTHASETLFAVHDPRYTPQRANAHDAGFDLRARLGDGPHVLGPGERTLFPTGVYAAIPPGHVGLVCPRSGNAIKHGLTVLNAPGIIDSGYRGEIGVVLHNASGNSVEIDDEMRIAQLVIHRIKTEHRIIPHEQLPASVDERGGGGFGSTGR